MTGHTSSIGTGGIERRIVKEKSYFKLESTSLRSDVEGGLHKQKSIVISADAFSRVVVSAYFSIFDLAYF